MKDSNQENSLPNVDVRARPASEEENEEPKNGATGRCPATPCSPLEISDSSGGGEKEALLQKIEDMELEHIKQLVKLADYIVANGLGDDILNKFS